LLPSGGALHIHKPAVARYPPLLFLHGVGGGAWSWGPQVAALGDEFACFVWEGRGHGVAPPTSDAGLGDFYVDAREALAFVFEAAREPAIVVGHSMGGLIALALTCAEPAEVCAAFLVDPVYSDGNGDRHVTIREPLLSLVRLAISPIVRSYQRDGRLSRVISRRIFELAFEDRAAMERSWPLQRTQVPVEYPKMICEAFEGVDNFPFRPFADEVAVPTYLIEASSESWAKKPRFGQLAERLRTRLGEAVTYDVVKGGHYLQLDRPQEVTGRLAAFARRLVRA
jgi:pimeloyl-ACP methyl ester carboxylesterase